MPSITRSKQMDPEAFGKLIKDIVHTEIALLRDEMVKENALVRQEISSGLKPIQATLDRLEGSLKDCVSKVQALEEAATHTGSRVDQLEKDYNSLKDKHDVLLQKTISLENHSRKFNILILGIKDGAEKGKPTAFVQDLLCSLFKEGVGPGPLLSIAHRVGPQRSGRARPMIARFHSLETKTAVQRLSARMAGRLIYQGDTLNIFPDIPPELRRQQAAFSPVRALLRKTTLKYGIVYPAKLLITFQNVTHTFTKVEEAIEFYDKKIKPTLE